MPRTARTVKRHSNPMHGSYQPDARQSEISRTPVLFRLPRIQVSLPPAGESDQPLQLRAETPPAEASVVKQPPPIQADTPMSTLPPKESSQGLPASGSPSTASTSVEEAPVPASVVVEAASESDRSWWDHWSSGVVLILLIIALITASIIAFNDRAESDPGLFVDQSGKQASADHGLNLESIQVPDVKEDMESEIIAANSEKSQAASAQVKEPGSQSAGPDSDEAAASAVAAHQTADSPTNGSLPNDSLIPDTLDPLAKEAVQEPSESSLAGTATPAANEQPYGLGNLSMNSSSQQTVASQATSGEGTVGSVDASPNQFQLMPPIPDQPAPLFPPLPTSTDTLAGTSDVPATTSGSEGGQASPTQGGMNAVATPEMTSAEPSQSMVSTNMPDYTKLLGVGAPNTSTPQLSQASAASGPSISMASLQGASQAPGSSAASEASGETAPDTAPSSTSTVLETNTNSAGGDGDARNGRRCNHPRFNTTVKWRRRNPVAIVTKLHRVPKHLELFPAGREVRGSWVAARNISVGHVSAEPDDHQAK